MISLTPGQAWMRRFAGVTCRRGQVWTNSIETIVIIDEPELVNKVKFLSCFRNTGWCHPVVKLETSRVYYMNEIFFVDSGTNIQQWTRLA